MPVFISWSDARSKHVASALSSLLETTIPGLGAWMSQHSIEPGADWAATLRRVLAISQYGVLCLTPENVDAPWLLFEAGAISKNLDKAEVVPYLLGVKPGDLAPPLGLFQGLNADEEGTWQLLLSVNSTLPQPMDKQNLRGAFAAAWPAFNEKVAPILDAESPATARELQRARDQMQSFGSRVQGAWFERITDEGIGLFSIRMDARYNSVRVSDGYFYSEDGQFTAEYRSAVVRIDEQGDREGIVYLRECYREDRDRELTWFHGYGEMWFDGSKETPYQRGRGKFFDGDLKDPRKTIVKGVKLRRVHEENEVLVVEHGTDAERQALAQAALKRPL